VNIFFIVQLADRNTKMGSLGERVDSLEKVD
jgi:hypothetical protein